MQINILFLLLNLNLSLCSVLIADSPTEIYQKRIIPLLQSSKASSCSQCHLQGVKLEDFLTSDPKKSFASLRSRGWIDIEQPSESKLLKFIAKKPSNSNAMMDQVRASELEAIGQWIHSSVQDPESLNTPLPELNDLKLDNALILHARRDQVLSRFVDVVWSQLERCANCHSPDRNAKQIEKNGPQMSWIVPNSPDDTLRLLLERKLIDLENPAASLLKTKALGQDEHGGGVKFPADGQTDREWGRFLEDYVSIQKAHYKKADSLPSFSAMRTWRTGLHLRLSDLPQLPTNQYAVILMHRINSDGSVADEAIAMGEGRVSKDGTGWSSTLVILEPSRIQRVKNSQDLIAMLPDGKYRLQWLVVDDSKTPLEQILKIKSTAYKDIDSLWKPGHSAAKTISFGLFESLDILK